MDLKPDKQHQPQRIALIGMGWIGEHIRPCYEKALGDKLSENMIAFKRTRTGLARLRQTCPFPILAGDYREAFMQFEPSLIILSTQPGYIKSVTEDVVKPYIQNRRSEGKALPLILSFAPTPNVRFFNKALGNDAAAFTVLPAMETEVAGLDCRTLSNTMLTPNPDLPLDDLAFEEAKNFLSHLAQVFVVPLPEILPILSAKIAYHMMDLACQDLAADWFGQEADLGQQYTAGRMRYFFLRDVKTAWSVAEPISEAIYPAQDDFLEELQRAWYAGADDFLFEHGTVSENIQRICRIAFELHLLCLQMESSSTILEKVASHATQGGMTECAVNSYRAKVRPVLLEALHKNGAGHMKEMPSMMVLIRDSVKSLAQDIYSHGLRLAD